MNTPRLPRTLVERMSPIRDRAQRLRARLGAVPWRTAIVLYRWTGGSVGKGEPVLVRVQELTPPPDVHGEGGLRGQSTSAGFVREGSVRLENLSARYTESDLDLLFRPLDAAEIVFIEVAHDTRDGVIAPPRRLYRPLGTPERQVTDATWSLNLERVQDPIRGRYNSGAWPVLP